MTTIAQLIGTNAIPEWVDDALCAQTDPDAFYPEKGAGKAEHDKAKHVCAKCPVRSDCLEWAISTDERYGIWGGLSERQRRRVKEGRQ